MVLQLAKEQSARLLKHVVRCYLRLSDNPRAREALRQCLPDQLKDNTFANCLKDDNSTKKWLASLLKNLEGSAIPGAGGPGAPLVGGPGLTGPPQPTSGAVTGGSSVPGAGGVAPSQGAPGGDNPLLALGALGGRIGGIPMPPQ